MQLDFRLRDELQRQEKEKHKARNRAMSDTTERPALDFATETFDQIIDAFGIRFDTVKLFHGRPGLSSYTERALFIDPMLQNA